MRSSSTFVIIALVAMILMSVFAVSEGLGGWQPISTEDENVQQAAQVR